MRTFFSSGLRRGGALFRTVAVSTVLALVISGCNEPVSTYQVADAPISGGEKVLVLPFMDTRTFIDGNDPHKDGLGNHARDIFVSAMRENQIGKETVILTPDLPTQSLSLTNAQLAEYGRLYDADIVVAGQMFSYTGTRAASIPPRAGMFVRVVSAKDGTLLFVGDHYHAAPVPGAKGGRDLQAKRVSSKLIEGMAATRELAMWGNSRRIASNSALASIATQAKILTANNAARISQGDSVEPLPLPPPPVDLPDLATVDADAWDTPIAPELPSMLDFEDDFFSQTYPAADSKPEAEKAVAEAAPVEKVSGENADAPSALALAAAEPGPGIVPMPPPMLDNEVDADDDVSQNPVSANEVEGELASANEAEGETELRDETSDADHYAAAEHNTYDWVRDASDAARMTGDELAADLFESETPLLEESLSSPAKFNPGQQVKTLLAEAPAVKEQSPVSEVLVATVNDSETQEMVVTAAATHPVLPTEPTASEWRTWESAQGVAFLIEAGQLEVTQVEQPEQDVPEIELAVANPRSLIAALDDDNGPVISVPLAVEQPRSFRTVDLAQVPTSEAAILSFISENAYGQQATTPGAVRVLVLPYHERINSNNLIDSTGGGEVVTTLYGSQLALDPEIQVLWDGSGQTSHDRLIGRDEALQLGRMVNADYVVRGQVVEFRRAQSVPSFYSAMISTAVLAAQIFFAEMSGVDVATEVYRVSDGMCVMSRRDRAQQKYVVQAEKTVRRLAAGMSESVIKVMKSSSPEAMDPLIDTVEPVTVLSNPW